MSPPTALEVAGELSRESRRALGANLVAVILHGSLASGDFVPTESDIDVLVVIHQPLSHEHKRVLGDSVALVARRNRAWMDFRVVTADVAERPQRVPMLDFSVGVHAGLPAGIEVEQGPAPEPDLLFEFAICRDEGRSLVGPDPATLIGAVPNHWLLEVGDAYLKRWQEVDYDDQSAGLMVFTACRLWFRSVEGGHCSKSDAARWVLQQDPELAAPKLALERRSTGTGPLPEQDDVIAVLARVRGVIADRT